MGLDMYLHAKKYISKIDMDKAIEIGFENVKPTEEWSTIVDNAGLKDIALKDIYGAEVSVVVAYWRKANQIHRWFVDNIQKGEDDCGEYYVSADKLNELLDTCCRALIHRDSSLLPPIEGFFFGSTEVDEWYWHKIQETVDQLERVLKGRDLTGLSFQYSSSW